MDPFSIACTVGAVGKTVYNVTQKIYTFFDDAAQIDDTVKDLARELDGLKNSLQAIESGLKLPALYKTDEYNKDQSSQLGKALTGNLKSCETTMDRLNEVLEEQLRGANSSFVNRATRQIKLNWKKDQIMSWRGQIHVHTSALNLALQMVNVYATSMVPGAIIGDLGPRIDQLRVMIEQTPSGGLSVGKVAGSPPNIKALGDLESKAMSLGQSQGDGLNQAGFNDDTFEQIEKLKESARTIISSAATVVAQSEAGGSVCGPIDDPNRDKTLSWLSNSDRVPPTTMSNQSRGAAPLASETGESHQTPLTDHGVFHLDDSGSNDDSGTELDFDVDEVAKYMVMGQERFNKCQYADAKRFLLKGIAKANELPAARRDTIDLLNSELTLAACYYHMDDLEGAKSQLLTLAHQQPTTSKKESSRVYQAYHLLSQVLFLQGHIVESERYCKLALRGRRKLRSSQPLYESEALMSEICMSKGDTEGTELYREMIPEELRSKMIAQVRKIPSAASTAAQELPATPSPTSEVSIPSFHSPTTSLPVRPHSESLSTIDTIRTFGSSPPNRSIEANNSFGTSPIPRRPTLQESSQWGVAVSNTNPPARPTMPAQNRTSIVPVIGSLIGPNGAMSPVTPDPGFARRGSSVSVGDSESGKKPRSTFGLFKAKSRSPSSDSTARGESSAAAANTHQSSTGEAFQFCQSACWMREKGIKGGMSAQAEPVGLTGGMRGFWKCKTCAFQSQFYSRALKPAEMEQIQHKWDSGVQYKWIFLAKSHRKKDKGALVQTYGCIFCEAEGRVGHTYFDDTALLTHIFMDHSNNMSATLQSRHRVVIGRALDKLDEWDIHIPNPIP